MKFTDLGNGWKIEREETDTDTHEALLNGTIAVLKAQIKLHTKAQ